MATYVLQRKESFYGDIEGKGMLKEIFECGVSIFTNHPSNGVFSYFGRHSLIDAVASHNSASLIERGTSRRSQKGNMSLAMY
jgi:hypothetical protein